MRKRGEPQRKVQKLEKQHSDEHPPANADGPERDQQISGTERKGVMNTQKGRQDDEPKRESGAQKKLKKGTKREKREQKTKERKEREAAKAKKKKEGEDFKTAEKRRDADKKSTKDIRMVWEGRSRIEENSPGSGVRKEVTTREQERTRRKKLPREGRRLKT